MEQFASLRESTQGTTAMKTISMKLVRLHKNLAEYQEVNPKTQIPLEKYTTVSPVYIRQRAFADSALPAMLEVTLLFLDGEEPVEEKS
jgi:hypothetical protein